MGSGQDLVAYVVEQLGPRVRSKAMFGEYGLYLDGKFVAVAADNMLFLKPTEPGRALLPSVVEGRPYPEARPWFVVDEALDEPDLLRCLLQATAAALPPAMPKPRGRTPRAVAGRKPPLA